MDAALTIMSYILSASTSVGLLFTSSMMTSSSLTISFTM